MDSQQYHDQFVELMGIDELIFKVTYVQLEECNYWFASKDGQIFSVYGNKLHEIRGNGNGTWIKNHEFIFWWQLQEKYFTFKK